MRISCNAFARLTDDQGRYALLLNRGRLKHNNERILSPIGGGIEVGPGGLNTLLTKKGATDFEQGLDLRFRVDDTQVSEVIEWFLERTQRETSVLRELQEELIGECKLLRDQDLAQAKDEFAGYVRYDARTARQQVKESKTVYLIEVYDVSLPAHTKKKLWEQASGSKLYLATEVDILRGWINGGPRISPICKTLFEPRSHIPH